IEAQARAMHKDIKELTLEEMDQLWNEAKQNENQ
ncbi:MAG: nucleoside triphosphate pyrophosphohydrolase, partial [Prevotellaceae bacterium]|nr:nucleoside triphosphate pyrophosphohydrolase [Prevotellaceae bacterium]